MENLAVKRYENVKTLLSETAEFLHDQEINNALFLTNLYGAVRNNETSSSSAYGCKVYDATTGQTIFAFLAFSNSFLYASSISSHIPEEQYEQIINLLVKDFLSTSYPITTIQAYEPVLTLLKQAFQQQGGGPTMSWRLLEHLWSYQINQVTWSPRLLEIIRDAAPGTTELKKAQIDDLPLLVSWTTQSFRDTGEDTNFLAYSNIEQLCLDDLLGEKKGIYILYVDGIPVSMTWKRRPLRNGCSIANVYTPAEYRHKGYGAICVSMATELFLENYRYVTLFAQINRDPNNNLYTSVGYNLVGKAGRYTIL